MFYLHKLGLFNGNTRGGAIGASQDISRHVGSGVVCDNHCARTWRQVPAAAGAALEVIQDPCNHRPPPHLSATSSADIPLPYTTPAVNRAAARVDRHIKRSHGFCTN